MTARSLRAAPATLDALGALRAALDASGHHMDRFLVVSLHDDPWPDATSLGPARPCPFGLGAPCWISFRPSDPHRPDLLGVATIRWRLTPLWGVCADLLCEGGPAFADASIPRPRRWSEATLAQVRRLVDRAEGFHSFQVQGPGAVPQGDPQPCDLVPGLTEWVDQRAGACEDNHHGTVSWPMAGRLLVGSYTT